MLGGMSSAEKRVAYDCDITYGQNNEFGFDYLRDNMKLELSERSQRGHFFAIVDEVDSILVDEARTPLIISGPSDKPAETYKVADQLVRKLSSETDYEIDLKSKQVTLTDAGVQASVNDYLAKRDAEWMGILYKYLGLTVGVVVHGIEPAERKAAYACDITYGTNNEFGFDYLRDNMVQDKNHIVQRDLHYAIVDEVYSILVDEARTPLIISAPAQESTSKYVLYSRLIPRLVRDQDCVFVS